LGRTAAQAVGYREVLSHLRGEISLPETQRRVKVRTHQFARRQETWFRSLSECRRIEMDGVGNPAEVAEKLLELGQATGV
jgi:tRNA dimethylallyltransferase